MGNSLLCQYIDNCFKKGIILWGQNTLAGGAKLRNGGAFAPPVPMLKKALLFCVNTLRCLINIPHPLIDFSTFYRAPGPY